MEGKQTSQGTQNEGSARSRQKAFQTSNVKNYVRGLSDDGNGFQRSASSGEISEGINRAGGVDNKTGYGKFNGFDDNNRLKNL